MPAPRSKQSVAERLREKQQIQGQQKASSSTGSAGNHSNHNHARDIFHNGQVPASRILQEVAFDVFPELSQQQQQQQAADGKSTKQSSSSSASQNSHNHSKNSIDSNSSVYAVKEPTIFGRLVRWHTLQSHQRKLVDGMGGPIISDDGQVQPGAAARKKRKKKKKKKGAGANDNSNNITSSPSSDAHDKPQVAQEESALSEQMIQMTAALASSSNNSIDGSDKDSSAQTTNFNGNSTPEIIDTEKRDSAKSSDGGHHENGSVSGAKTPLDGRKSFGTKMFDQIRPQEESIRSLEGLNDTTSPEAARKRALSVDSLGPSSSPQSQSQLQLSTSMDSHHELIPPESAVPLEEIPPSKIVENPLDIPYLLTLESNEQILSQAIHSDGTSDIDKQTSSTAKQLSSSKSLYEDWVRQLLDAKADTLDRYAIPPNRTLNDFLKYLESSCSYAENPIPFSRIFKAIDSIECKTCQEDVRREASDIEKSLFQSNDMGNGENGGDNTLVLDPSTLGDKNGTANDSDVDMAFDYVALEEGRHVNNDPKKIIDLENRMILTPVRKDPSGSVSTSNKNHNPRKASNLLQVSPITESSLLMMIDEWLPSGIEEDVMVTALPESSGDSPSAISAEEIQQFHKDISEKETHAQKSLDVLQMIQENLSEQLQKLRNKPKSGNLDYYAMGDIQKCDEACRELSNKILQIIRKHTSEVSNSLPEMQLHLWTEYLRSLTDAVRACDDYYSTLAKKFMDEQGVLVKFFASEALRDCYQNLVEQKGVIWTQLSRTLRTALTSQALKEWYTREMWADTRAVLEGDEESFSLDINCHELTDCLVKWSETINAGKFSDIQKRRFALTEEVLERLQDIVEPLSNAYSKLEMYFSRERNKYFASLRSSILVAQGVKSRMRLIDAEEIEPMATGVILIWRQVRLMQNRMIRSVPVPPLPLQLKHWALQDPHFKELQTAFFGQFCRQGYGGSRRLMCTVAGVLYEWLSERCKAWDAMMSEKELLMNLNDEIATGGSPYLNSSTKNKDEAKAGKKNKKKKKANEHPEQKASESSTPTQASFFAKKSESRDHIVSEEEKPHYTYTDPVVEEVPRGGVEESKEVDEDDGSFSFEEYQRHCKELEEQRAREEIEERLSLLVLEKQREEFEEALVGKNLVVEQEAAMPSKPEPNINRAQAPSERTNSATQDKELESIYVLDGNKKVSAQDFLVSRLSAVLYQDEKVVYV